MGGERRGWRRVVTEEVLRVEATTGTKDAVTLLILSLGRSGKVAGRGRSETWDGRRKDGRRLKLISTWQAPR